MLPWSLTLALLAAPAPGDPLPRAHLWPSGPVTPRATLHLDHLGDHWLLVCGDLRTLVPAAPLGDVVLEVLLPVVVEALAWGAPDPRPAPAWPAREAWSADGALHAVAREADGRTVLTVTEPRLGAAPLWEHTFEGAPSVRELRFAPDGAHLGVAIGGFVLGAASEGALYFDRDGRVVGNDPAGPSRGGRSGAFGTFGFSADGRYALAAKFDRRVTVRDLARGAVTQEFDVPREAYSHFAEVATAPEGPWYMLAYPERRLAYVGSCESGPLPEGRLELAGRGFGGWSEGRLELTLGDRLVTLEEGALVVRRLPTMAVVSRTPSAASMLDVAPDGRFAACVEGRVVRVLRLAP